MDYTEKMHAETLLRLLEDKQPICLRCPRDEHDEYFNYITELPGPFFSEKKRAACIVCRQFVGLDSYTYVWHCPCHVLKRDAIKHSWLALEEKGYLE